MLFLLLACTGPEPEPAPQPTVEVEARRALVLVTLDTTRADALGVYGGPEGASPVFDRLASEGVRFEWAISHVPTTLSSHASMMTGLDPHGHAIPRNGYPLADEIDTLAERLSAAGWDTRAVVAASAVDTTTNLQQGFAAYDDQLGIDKGKRYEARGDDVTRRAFASVDASQADKPLFLWVHYYDAHTPYEAPKEFRSRWTDPKMRGRFGKPGGAAERAAELFRAGQLDEQGQAAFRALYQAEVAYADDQLGQLLAGLDERGLQATVVVTADHGEMFFEDRSSPVGHGTEVDLPITHVPLVVHGPGIQPGVVDTPVRLSDVGPTLLGLAGLPSQLGTGQDLGPALRGEPIQANPAFLEATKPKRNEQPPAWNNLYNERGVVDQGHVLLSKRGRERLYLLEEGQPSATDSQVQESLGEKLEAWDANAPEWRPETMTDEVRAALEALGYLDE